MAQKGTLLADAVPFIFQRYLAKNIPITVKPVVWSTGFLGFIRPEHFANIRVFDPQMVNVDLQINEYNLTFSFGQTDIGIRIISTEDESEKLYVTKDYEMLMLLMENTYYKRATYNVFVLKIDLLFENIV